MLKFEFLFTRPFSKATEKTEKTMFLIESALHWTENQKFVYNNQQCFVFQIQIFDSNLLYCEVDSLKPS